jgi:hypothetical protein
MNFWSKRKKSMLPTKINIYIKYVKYTGKSRLLLISTFRALTTYQKTLTLSQSKLLTMRSKNY